MRNQKEIEKEVGLTTFKTPIFYICIMFPPGTNLKEFRVDFNSVLTDGHNSIDLEELEIYANENYIIKKIRIRNC